MSVPHADAAAVMMPDSSIVVISGVTASSGELTPVVEVFDKQTRRWRVAGSLLIARRQHTAIVISADEILVLSGRDRGLTSMGATEIFNIRSGRSTRVGDFPYPMNLGVSAITSDGKIIAGCGRSGGEGSFRSKTLYAFNRSTSSWQVWGDLPIAMVTPAISRLSDGRLVFINGSQSEGIAPNQVSNKVFVEQGNGFQEFSTLMTGRAWSRSAVWSSDSVLIVGGYNSGVRALNTTEWLNIATGSASPAPSMRDTRMFTQVVSLQGKILAIAGLSDSRVGLSSIEILDRTAEPVSSDPNAPRITSFTPQSAGVGASLTIRGSGLRGATRVTVGGVAVSAFVVQSDSVIVATLGAGASGAVRVATPIASAALEGFVFTTPPVITAFTPSRAKVGATIVISGSGFVGATTVTIGGVAAEIFSVDSDSRITAVAAEGTSSGAVVVLTRGGEARRAGFLMDIPPVITALQDSIATLGDTIRIQGRNFIGTTEVRFGTTTASARAVSFRALSDSLVIAVVGSGFSGGVLVTTPAGTAVWRGFRYLDQMTNVGQFGYGMYQPAIDSKGNIYISQEMRGVWKIEPNGKSAMVLGTPNRLAGGIAIDSNDNVFIVDKVTDGIVGTRIVKLTPSGAFSVVAESPLFQSIYGLVMDKDGNMYAVSYTNNAIVKITQSGIVTFLYSGAPLDKPVGLNFDKNGDLLITNYGGAAIVRYSMCSGQTSIVYDGTAIRLPHGIISTQSGNIYIADHLAGAILKMTPDGAFEEFIGSNAPFPRNITLLRPTGMALTKSGTMYVVDYQNGRIVTAPSIDEKPIERGKMGSPLAITAFTPTTGSTGQVINIRGMGFSCGIEGVFVGGAPVRTFRLISDSLIVATVGNGASGDVSVVTENSMARLAEFTFIGTTSGSTTNPMNRIPPQILSFTPNAGTSGLRVTILGRGFLGTVGVRFGSTSASVAASSFTVVSDSVIIAVVANGASGSVFVATSVGMASREGFRFIQPTALIGQFGYGMYLPVIDSRGNIFVMQELKGLWRISPDGRSELVYRPKEYIVGGLTIDKADNLYMTLDTGFQIHRYSPNGESSLFCKHPLVNMVTGLDIDKDGNLYGAAFGNNSIIKISADGKTVTTLYKGSPLNGPANVALDNDGNLIVANYGTAPSWKGSIVKITPCGEASVIGEGSQFRAPYGLAVAESRNLYIGGYLSKNVIKRTPQNLYSDYSSANTQSTQVLPLLEPVGVAISPEGWMVVVDYKNGSVWRVADTGEKPLNRDNIAVTPAITAFTPTTGTVGQTLTIRGTRFACGVSRVSVGGVAVRAFSVVSDSLIVATVSTGATGAVIITTPLGTASRERFVFISPSTTSPSVVVTTPTVTLPPPTITAFTPTQGTSGTLISIIGSGFRGVNTVLFGSATNATPAASFLVRSDSLIIATLGVGATGSVTVISTTGIATRPGFVFLFPTAPTTTTPTVVVTPRPDSVGVVPPTITSIAPSCVAGGTLLTITGTGFTGRPEVRFGRLASGTNTSRLVLSASVGVVSTTQILAVVPSGLVALTGLPSGSREFGVSVSTTSGTATRSGLQYVETRPAINAFSPSSATRGDRLFIVGQGFTCLSDVRVGGNTVASYQVVSDTLVIATLGLTTSGTVRIVTPTGVAESGGFVYSVFPLSLLPSITSFSPTAARVGQTVTITGSNFSGTMTVGGTFTTTFVSLGGVLLPFTVVSPTQITVRIPSDFAPTNTDVRVGTPGGSVSAQGFTFIPEPIITSFTPERASTGTVVLISGRNFTGTNAVQFGSAPAQAFTVLSDTLIQAVVGDGASGDVRVTTNNGTASKSGFTFVIPPPFITSFTPTLFAPSANITITGRNFSGNGYTTQLVLIGNVAGTIVSVNPTTLVVRAPAMINSTTITVITPGGTANACCLTMPPAMMPMLPQPPRILGFSPASAGVGAAVTIRGENFTGASDVRFGGVTVASFRVVSATEIQAVVGAGATGEVSVRTPVGAATFAGFTFILPPQPIITGFSPATGAMGDTVRVRGQYLQTVSAFTIQGDPAITVNATFTTSGDTLVTAVLGAGQSFSLGTINLRTLGGTARATGFTFIAAPVITSFSPAIGGIDDAIVINGAGFDNVQSVAFGVPPSLVQAASYVVNSPSRITARLSTGATGSVVVTTRGGSASRTGFVFAPVPVITRFTPDSARAGETVRIVGSGFLSQSAVSVVNFGGVRAASYTVVSDSVITAVPAQTGATGAISLTTPGGTAQRSGFVFLAPLPTITSFSPAQASVGDIVTIIGTNLNGATSVSFGSRAAASFLVSSPTQIVARVGNGTSGTITVQTPGGRATALNFVFIPAPPVITSFSPDSAASGQTITLRGRDFSGITAVRFTAGATTLAAQSFSVSNDSTMTVRVPALGANRVTATLTVQSPNGAGSREGLKFVPAPSISAFTPTSATAGTTVVLTGTNLSAATAVRFGGTNARSFVVNSDTQITAVLGAGASGAVSVVSYGGTGSRDGFTFLAEQVVVTPPAITSFTPQAAPANATVTITGTNFTGNGLSGVTGVQFGGVQALSYAVLSPTTITAVVGVGASGAITITSARGNSTLAGFRFIPAPVITDFTPKSAGRNAVVSIIGRNFAGATSVSFGGTAVQFTVSGDTLIRATLQIGSTGAVSVTTPGGTATLAGFTFTQGFIAADPKGGATLTGVRSAEALESGTLRVFPNPASDILVIELMLKCTASPLRITFRNAVGVAVMTLEARSTDGILRKEVNVSGLAAGAYSVEMLCGAERVVGRFVRF